MKHNAQSKKSLRAGVCLTSTSVNSCWGGNKAVLLLVHLPTGCSSLQHVPFMNLVGQNQGTIRPVHKRESPLSLKKIKCSWQDDSKGFSETLKICAGLKALRC